MNRLLCFFALLLVSASPPALHAQTTITFEPDAGGFLPDGSPAVEDMEINDQFLSYGVRFGLDANMDGVRDAGSYPLLELVGGGSTAGGLPDSEGFNSHATGIRDTAAPGFEAQLGDFFLRSPHSAGNNTLLIEYTTPVPEAAGELWDIDAWQGNTEQWRVEALSESGKVIASVESPEGTDYTLDARPWSFVIDAPGRTQIKALRLVFIGTKTNGIGVAFNNFSPSGPLPGDPMEWQVLPAVELRWNSEPGTVYQVQWRVSRQDRWQNLGAPLTGTGGILSLFDSDHGQRRSYRVIEQ